MAIKRKIHNAYADIADYNCFGCAPTNPIGLRLNFWEEGDYIYAEWEPTCHYEGYINMLHGGIQATLLDEIADWVLIVKLGTSGVTKNLNITYHKPVFVNHGTILLKAKLISHQNHTALIHTELLDKTGIVRSSADIEYFVHPQEIAKKKYHLPNYEFFFKE